MILNKTLPVTAALLLFASSLAASDDPVLVAEPSCYDFGEILSGEVIHRQIVLRNTGKSLLLVKKIEFSCGCTIPKIVLSSGEEIIPELEDTGSFVELRPDEWAQIKLEFQTIGRFGEVKHRMDIYTNDPEGQVRHIPILAVVKRALAVDPPRAEFGLLDRKERKTVELRVVSEGVGDFKITGIEKPPPFLSWSAKKLEGEGPPASALSLTYKGGADVGKHSFRLKVEVENEKVKNFGVYVDMRVYPSVIFRFDGKRIFEFLDIGLLERGREKKVSIEIVNGDLAVPYRISNVYCKSNCTPPVKAVCTPEIYGTSYRLDLTVSPKVDRRFVRGRVFIQSDHPDMPQAVIRFSGLYR